MGNRRPSMLLGGVVTACLLWGIGVFLGWEKFSRKRVILDGRIWAHRCQGDDETGHEQVKSYLNAALLILRLAMGKSFPILSWAIVPKSVEYFLMYTYDYKGTNYLHEEKVNVTLYNALKDGDSVKLRCLPQNPMVARLEKPLLSRS